MRMKEKKSSSPFFFDSLSYLACGIETAGQTRRVHLPTLKTKNLMFALARVHKGTRDVLEVRRTFPCEREDTLGNSCFFLLSRTLETTNSIPYCCCCCCCVAFALRDFFSSFLFVQTSPHRFDKNFICCLFFECFSFPSWLCVCLLSRLRDFSVLTPFDSRDCGEPNVAIFALFSEVAQESRIYFEASRDSQETILYPPSIFGWFIGIAMSKWNSENSFVITRQPNVDWMICDGAKRRNVFRWHQNKYEFHHGK